MPSVHNVVSFDFAVALVPGGHSTLFTIILTAGYVPLYQHGLGNVVIQVTKDPSEHVRTALHGLHSKTIAGVAYPAVMPPFGSHSHCAEVAAVVNHERSRWGNDALLSSPRTGSYQRVAPDLPQPPCHADQADCPYAGATHPGRMPLKRS